ncbi:MAG: putative manganese-dependent inorganic diphosphatase [Lachnospiraceae bacterium]|nr:putative manganese-dependent inorganic diphosphatase [Lachnospiraceae bacterium]
MAEQERKIFVVGHKNPDTDSICSAIAYANLKRILTGKAYVPMRAGQINAETQYILDRFGVKMPEYIADVSTQVRDIEIRTTAGVDSQISLKKAWTLMKKQNVVTLPITEGRKLSGLITISDIATSYMEVYDSKILAEARTPYANILETLDGTMVVGDAAAMFDKGKVLIAAANPDLMEDYIEEHDLVILGNRYESQLCAIEMRAGCIIVCEGAKISHTIQMLAKEHGCTVISTPHDTYTVARLIHQSMPIAHFMVRDNLNTFQKDAFVEEIKNVMAQKRNRDFPILDHKGNYCGMISRRNLLNMRRKQVVLVDHNEKTQAVDGVDEAEILEIIDHHRLGTIETMSPVFFRNQPLGCTATIIYQMYQENGVEIDEKTASLLCAAILSDTLMYRSPTCTEVDRAAAEALAAVAKLDVTEFAGEMFEAGSDLKLKSSEEIFYQDFKKFSAGNITFGVGQINSMNALGLAELKERLLPYMEKAYRELGVDMVFFMLTNIIRESTEVLYIGSGAESLLENAFHGKAREQGFLLSGVVSRKKQMIPAIVAAVNA